jgi:hypothetical protein
MAALLLLLSVVAGRCGWLCIRSKPEPLDGAPASTRRMLLAEESFCAVASGFALVSAGVFLLAHFGCLSTRVVGVCAGLGATACGLVCWRRRVLREALAHLPLDLALGVLLFGLTAAYAALLPPLDTTVAASDSSVYLANARQLARHGTILHRDPLVTEMTVREREVLLANRFGDDRTGLYARFPGGVPLLSPSGDAVSFCFYHLFPAWLALGLETIGEKSYLQVLGLFGGIGLLSLFLIGWRLGGIALGLSVCVVHASFYPQAFYSRFPSSELLAQALFLSGLCVFMRGQAAPEGRRAPYGCLAGMLWGAFCLCRVDAMPFLWLGLTVLALLPARLGIRRADWALPMLLTVLFASMAVYHQLANGADYFSAFSQGRLAPMVSAAVAGRRWPSLIVVGVLAAAGWLGYRCASAPERCGRLFAIARAFGLAVSALTIGRFVVAAEWGLVTTHVRWIGMYATPPALAVLGVGALLAVLTCLGGRPASGAVVALAFFVGPAVCYLIDPMVVGQQPWAIRRFVPVIFPLLFVLSLYGWQAGLRRLFGARPAFARAVHALLVIAVAGRFLGSSIDLFGRPENVRSVAEVRALARAVPEDALVLVSDDSAGLHLQLALEYACGRNVLLLPLRDDPAPKFEEVMNGYLERRLANGARVFVVLTGTADIATPFVRHFELERRFEGSLSFEKVFFTRHDVFPPPPHVATLRSYVFEVCGVRRAGKPVSDRAAGGGDSPRSSGSTGR